MSIFENIVNDCRTAHSYLDQSVDHATIQKALELSLAAPNHKFTFPWKYYWLSKEVRSKIVDLFVELKGPKEEKAREDFIGKAKSKFLYPEIISIAQKKSEDAFQSKEDYATLSCSIQIMALSLAEQGIGYKWSTGGISNHPLTYELLNCPKDEYELIGLIMIGYPSQQAPQKKRPSLNEVLNRI